MGSTTARPPKNDNARFRNDNPRTAQQQSRSPGPCERRRRSRSRWYENRREQAPRQTSAPDDPWKVVGRLIDAETPRLGWRCGTVLDSSALIDLSSPTAGCHRSRFDTATSIRRSSMKVPQCADSGSPSSQKPIAQRTLHGRLRGLTAQRLSDATQARPSAAASRSTNSLPARRTLEPMLWTGWRRTGPFFSSHPAHTARGCDLLLRRGAAGLCVDGLLCRMATSDVGGAESAVTAAGRCSSGTPTARTCPIEPVPAPQRRVPSARARHRTRPRRVARRATTKSWVSPRLTHG